MAPNDDQPPAPSRFSGRISLFVSDVDGTLVTPDKSLTPGAIAASAKLAAAGIAFTVVSSRPPRGFSMLVGPLNITHPFGAFNGGTIVAPDYTVIEQQTVPADAARAAIAAIRDHGADPWLFTGTEWIITDPQGEYVPLERRTVQFEPTIVPDLAPYYGKAGKIVGASKDAATLAACESLLQRQLGGAASVRRSQTYYLDVTPPGTDKGVAVRALARTMNIPLHEVAVIGDMANDLPMFAVAGYKIAMGNGSDEVKAQADQVTLSNTEDGFAHAVDEFILPHAPRPGDHL
ncbi:Cof-type HAD-IIB family hydrolase [Rhodoligotrophos appendicifer]|uniref:Cof-type HAD-IIB family hydrolase n=1 Tax=Rhodoligotrophos appendicifer TaxID=987056 RepID=UPI0011858AAF|nr:Cof-type HAD-IIB family hydrolase [Rhodoligotrophos appendicifer]